MTQTISDDVSVKDDPQAVQSSALLRVGNVPVIAGGAERLTAFVALISIALGLVALRDFLVAIDQISGQSWLGWVISHIDGLMAGQWLWAVVAGGFLLGLVFLVSALTPPPKSGLRLRNPQTVWVSRRGIERLVDDRVNQVGGVLDAKVQMRRKTLKINARCTDKSEQTKTAIITATVPVLSALEGKVNVSVSMRRSKVK